MQPGPFALDPTRGSPLPVGIDTLSGPTSIIRLSTAVITRRDFLKTTSLAAAALPFSGCTPGASSNSLRILILGGTSFLGPQQIAYALERGHSVSTFTRGRTVPTTHKALFEQVESLIGDRENDLESLKGREWDAVIDNSGRQVHWTTATAELLKDHVDLYVYTSSTGVYYPYLGDDITEDTELNMVVPDGITEVQQLEYGYGVMKAKSELEARKAFRDDRTIVVRPTYMMGPGDRTDRFTYWPLRLREGGQIMVPGPDDPVQYMDVRDIAEWMIRLVEQRSAGTFNGVGPAEPTTMMQFVEEAHAAVGSEADFIPIQDHDFLTDQGVHDAVPWIMPVGENYGSARANNARGKAAGLTYRPLAESVQDILTWWDSDVVDEERKARLLGSETSLMQRESGILSAWNSR